MAKLDFIFDFASPNAYYSYKVLPDILERTGAEMNIHPVLLGGLFKITGNQPPMMAFGGVKGKLEYEMLEMRRFAEKHKLTDFTFNAHFPMNTISLMRGLLAAQDLNCEKQYIDVVLSAMWEQNLKMDDPEVIATHALREASIKGHQVLIFDTAGRLHIDDELMDQLERLKEILKPKQILFVADSMTGQDAVRSARAYHERLGITGVVLTKLDGDARGGAALSVREVVGRPIVFAGVGERLEDLEQFHPDRMAGRILGMGDVASLVEKAQEVVDEKKAAKLEEKLRRNKFDLEDLRDQLKSLKKMGPLQSVMDMMPGMNNLMPKGGVSDGQERQLKRFESCIDSMTPKERRHPQLLNGSRKRRIAKGSGTSVEEINRLLRQYGQMRKLMKRLGKADPKALKRQLGL
jgi:signal recognition particle GTPase